MEAVLKTFALTGAVFLGMLLVWNLNTRLPRFPWDPFVSKLGFSLYLPIITAVVISMVIALIAGYLAH